MGLGSLHVERVVSCTRGIGAVALILGIGLIVWSFIMFPWNEAKRTPADWQVVIDPPDYSDSQSRPDDNMSRFNGPGLVDGSPVYAGPTQHLVDTHESRSAKMETAASLISYILPGIFLLLVSRYIARGDLWAYICVCLLCLGFVALYVTDLIAVMGFDLPIFQEPIVTETLLRPCALYLLAICINALPDARDESRIRRNRRRQQGQQPIHSIPPPTRIPPRPTGLIPPPK
jgi:hypothetical protein